MGCDEFCFMYLLCSFFLILPRIQKICSLQSLSKLNIVDLHDNQVIFPHCPTMFSLDHYHELQTLSLEIFFSCKVQH